MQTQARLQALAPASAGEVRHAGRPVVAFSEPMRQELDELRNFLAARVYRHPRVERIMKDAESVVSDLFGLYFAHKGALPPEWQEQAKGMDYARHVCDFIAGMTDRYALAEHRRLFDATPELR
jgi:dGTPase